MVAEDGRHGCGAGIRFAFIVKAVYTAEKSGTDLSKKVVRTA